MEISFWHILQMFEQETPGGFLDVRLLAKIALSQLRGWDIMS